MPKPTGFFHDSGPTPMIFGHHHGHEFMPTLWTSLGMMVSLPLLATIATVLIVVGDWVLSFEERRRRRAFEDAYQRIASGRRATKQSKGPALPT